MPVPSSALPIHHHHGILPIKPALLEFVRYRENLSGAASLILVPGLGPIAAAIDMVLVSADEYLASRPMQRVEAYTARLHYEITDLPHLHERRVYVNDTGAVLFNRFLEQLMRDDQYWRILKAKERGVQEKNTIAEFLDETNLNEFLELDTEKKGQYRLRRHRGIPSIRGKNLMRAAAC